MIKIIRKKVFTITSRIISGSLLFLLLSFSGFAWAADVSLTLNPISGYVGDSVTVSGTADPQVWVTIKVLDSDGNIVYLNSMISDANGNYSDILKVPDVSPGELQVVAGYGSNVANGSLTVKEKSGSSDGDSPSSSSNPVKHPVDKAFEQAEENEEGQLVGVIEIKEPSSEGQYQQDIPAQYFKEEKKVLKIETPIATVTLPDNMLTEKPKGEVSLAIKKVPKNELPEDAREIIGDKPVIDIDIMVDGKREKWSNDSVEVEIAIPYKPTEEELKNPGKIIAIYIDENGEVVPLTLSDYDPDKGAVIFRTTHFSYYGVQYADKNFEDIGRYTWAEEAIEALAARGVINGITEKEFLPQANITRADFVVLITRFFGLKGEATENFSDVKEGNYYYDAVGAAKEIGIVTGMGGNKFEPLKPITRQDMMVIIKRAVEITGQDSKLKENSGKNMSDFKDSDKVAGYAKDSVEYLINQGIVKGDGKNINPTSYTKRAEVAALLYELLKILNR